MVIKTLKRIDDSQWYLTSVSGAVVAQGPITATSETIKLVNINNFSPGVDVFVLFEDGQKFTEKLPKLY